MTLARMKVGDRCRITHIDVVDPSVVQLMMLGLVEDAECTCIGINPGRSSLALEIYGCTIAVPLDSVKNFTAVLV